MIDSGSRSREPESFDKEILSKGPVVICTRIPVQEAGIIDKRILALGDRIQINRGSLSG